MTKIQGGRYLVVRGPAGALNALVRDEIEVSLGGVVYPLVYHGASEDVAILAEM